MAVESRGYDPELDPITYGLPVEVRLLDRQDENLFLAEIPLGVIDRGEVAVDDKHVDNLARAMRNQAENQARGGQLQAGLVAQVVQEGEEPYLALVDGFHRTAAHEKNGQSSLYATLKTNSTREEVIDLRIIAATTHKPVGFSRIVDWVQDAWSLTEWSEKGLAIGQAFTLEVASETTTGARLQLTPEDVDEIRGWVQRKCELWNRPVSSIYNHLIVAHKAAPDLVQITRLGRTQKGELSKTQLKLIADALPFEFELQRRAAALILEHRMPSWQVTGLVYGIARADSPEEVNAVLDQDWSKPEPPTPQQASQASTYRETSTPAQELSKSRLPLPSRQESDSLAEVQIEQLYDRVWDLTVENAHLKVEQAVSGGRITINNVTERIAAIDPIETESEVDDETSDEYREFFSNGNEDGTIDQDEAVSRAQAGDTTLVDQYYVDVIYPKLERFVGYKVGTSGLPSHLEAEDVVLEVFERFRRQVTSPDFVVRYTLDTVAYRIAQNYIIDQWRRYKGTDLELDERRVSIGAKEQFAKAESMILDPRMKRAILSLPEDQLQAIIMKYFLGYELTNTEIGIAMTNTEGGVKSLLHRAKGSLKRDFGVEI